MFKTLLVAATLLLSSLSFAATDVNKATAAELDAIKGIGPAMSGKILDERKKGAFKDWNDFVTRVKGVGEGNAAKFSAEGLTVGGTTFKGAAPAAAKKDEKPAAKAEDKKADAAKPAPAAAAPAAPAAAPAAKKDSPPAAKPAAASKDDKKEAKPAAAKASEAKAPASAAKK